MDRSNTAIEMVSNVAPPDLYLGNRSEDPPVVDFDGNIRGCFILGRLLTQGQDGVARSYLWVRADPPVAIEGGGTANELLLSPRFEGDELDRLGDKSILVYVFTVNDNEDLRRGVLASGAATLFSWGDIARLPSLLPLSREEQFDEWLSLLIKYAGREGHTDVAPGHRENGVLLSTWVGNMRYLQAKEALPEQWAKRLEAVAGWHWLPGDDLVLLEEYSRREGHTDVPPEHSEQGRPLGVIVQQLRESHGRGGRWALEATTEMRLERIPNWHW